MAFPYDWDNVCPLTIDATKVGSGGATNFPVLLTEANFPTEMKISGGSNACNANGSDIRFSSDLAGATQLAREIENISLSTNPASTLMTVWVKVPSIPSTGNTTIYVWYNNRMATEPAVTDTYGRNAVWSNGFVSVFHLGESSGATATDSVGANNGTYQGNLPDQITGKVGKSQDFDGTGDYVSIANEANFDITGNITLSGWSRITTFTVEWQAVLTKGDSSYRIHRNSTNTGLCFHRDYSGGTAQANGIIVAGDGNWHHFFGVFSTSSGTTLHIDNTADGSDANTSVTSVNNHPVNIGENAQATGRYWLGSIDEIRIANVARDAAWRITEYNNQNSPSTFIITGTPRSLGSNSILFGTVW